MLQFTGFQDIYGREIYEGDVVRGKYGDTAVVSWEELPLNGLVSLWDFTRATGRKNLTNR
jgi:hypothetical protein